MDHHGDGDGGGDGGDGGKPTLGGRLNNIEKTKTQRHFMYWTKTKTKTARPNMVNPQMSKK